MLTSGMGMIRSNPEIEKAVSGLLTEDHNFDRNKNRSVHREPFVRHLRLEIRNIGQSIVAVSRHISAVGIEIITDQEVADRAIAELEIEHLKGPTVKIVAECRWCRSYGQNRFISGWQFQSLKR